MESHSAELKTGNNLTSRGTAMLKTLLPDSLKNKAKVTPITKGKDLAIPHSDTNYKLSEDIKCQQQCPPDSKPLARIAIVNNMMAKTTAKEEAFLLKRGSSGSSEGRRRRPRPNKITHSASDTACNQNSKIKEIKKRRSMSDYLDMKSEKHDFTLAERDILRKKPERKNSPNLSPNNLEHFCANPRKEESSKHQVKSKMNLLRGKLPSVTTWTSKPNDTQTVENKNKEGKCDDTTKEKVAEQQTVVKTRKTSTDIIKTAFQKKVNTMSGIQAWKMNTFKEKETPVENLTKTESMLKELIQDPGDATMENITTDPINTTKSSNGNEHQTLNHNKKVTLSVNRLTPIPSEEYQSDSDVDGTQNGEKEIPSSPQCQGSGRGILKKVSNVEIPNLELVQNSESTVKVKEETNNSPSRMVKFDMPSFESQTSEELPSITIDQYEENTEDEEPAEEEYPCKIYFDKATETIHECVVNTSNEEHFDDICNIINPIFKNSKMDRSIIVETINNIFGVLESLENHSYEHKQSRTDITIEDLVIQRNDCLTELKHTFRSLFIINKALDDNEILVEDIEKGENCEEDVEEVKTCSLVLQNCDLSTLGVVMDQHGRGLEHSETAENLIEQDFNKQDKQSESKEHTLPNRTTPYITKKSYSCPDLSSEIQNDLSNDKFAQIFVHKYQEYGDVEKVSCGFDEPDTSEPRLTYMMEEAVSVDSLQVDMEMIRNCLFMRETQIVDDFVML